jgi:tetratricopeptide (TPR) repeat protein
MTHSNNGPITKEANVMGNSQKEPRLSRKELVRLRGELTRLLDTDPHAAVDRARNLPHAWISEDLTTEFITASILTEAGGQLRDKAVLNEGRSIFERLAKEHPNHADILYNLGNALDAEARLRPYTGPSWYLETYDLRVRSRKNFHRAARPKLPAELRARALTNLGNSLWRSHRWVEAYDAYLRALDIEPSNVVARTGAVRVLLRAEELGVGNADVLRAVAARHLEKAKQDRDRLVELAGAEAAQRLAALFDRDIRGGQYPDLSEATDYEKFVARHRLAPSLTIEGLEPSVKRWDSLRLGSIIESLDRGAGVPPVFAMFNILKGDYIAARWLCYVALNKAAPESGWYADTLDYATYGTNPSLLILAQRATLDVLDKIAVFVTEYLSIVQNPRTITFRNRWHEKASEPPGLRWHPDLASELEAGNPGFIALAETALDVQPEGFLYNKKQVRDIGTHRFGIIHDIAGKPSRESRYITHYEEEEFTETLIETLRLVRASLVYLVEAVARREAAREKDGRVGRLFIPSHHWVRGDDENGDV